jgi:hypothetical protein
LNGAVEVLVIDSVLIVPNPGSGTGNLVAYKQNAIVSGIGLDLLYRRVRPGHDGRLRSYRGSNG